MSETRPSRERTPGSLRQRGAFALLVAAVIILALVLAGILGTRFLGSSDRRVTIDDDRISVELTVPKPLGITRVAASQNGDCGHAVYAFGRELMVEMYSTSCGDLSNERGPLNGFHGAYRTLGDVTEPQDVEEVETRLGRAQVFTQEYTECTNFCRDFEEPVAIIELDDPADPAFPSLVLIGEKGELSREQFTEIVTTLRS